MLNSQNLNEEETINEGQRFLTKVDTEIDSAKTIEHERKDGDDKNKRLAEKLRRSRIIGKKMLMEKEVQKNGFKQFINNSHYLFNFNSNLFISYSHKNISIYIYQNQII